MSRSYKGDGQIGHTRLQGMLYGEPRPGPVEKGLTQSRHELIRCLLYDN